jgi:hypothetical protein
MEVVNEITTFPVNITSLNDGITLNLKSSSDTKFVSELDWPEQYKNQEGYYIDLGNIQMDDKYYYIYGESYTAEMMGPGYSDFSCWTIDDGWGNLCFKFKGMTINEFLSDYISISSDEDFYNQLTSHIDNTAREYDWLQLIVSETPINDNSIFFDEA